MVFVSMLLSFESFQFMVVLLSFESFVFMRKLLSFGGMSNVEFLYAKGDAAIR